MPREVNRSDRVAGQLRRDLAHAKVYITVFEPDKAVTSLRALQRAAAFLRRRLGQELRMRHVPELHFMHDDSVERGSHIDSLIEQALDADRGASGISPADGEEDQE